MPPPRRGGIKRSSASVVRPSVRPSVCLSDVAYIGSNSKTKRPKKTKLCTGVPQVTCDSHTDFKVKRSKVKVSRGGAYCGGHLAAQLVHHNMTENIEQKVQQKSTQKRNKNNNNGTSYANLHITFSHDRYFATNFLLRFSTTVLGIRSNSNCARQ